MLQIEGLEKYSENGLLTDLGIAFEKYCVDLLRQNGFTNVSRTQSTKDNGIDIIGYKYGEKYGIQCKYSCGTIGIKAVQEALSGKTYYDCTKGMVLTNSSFNNNAVEYAEKLGIELWDENVLRALQNNTYKQNKEIYDFYVYKDTGRFALKTDEDFEEVIEWLEIQVDYVKEKIQGLFEEMPKYSSIGEKDIMEQIKIAVALYNTERQVVGNRYPCRLNDIEIKKIRHFAERILDIKSILYDITEAWKNVNDAFGSLYVLESIIDNGTVKNPIFIRNKVYGFMDREQDFINTITLVIEKTQRFDLIDLVEVPDIDYLKYDCYYLGLSKEARDFASILEGTTEDKGEMDRICKKVEGGKGKVGNKRTLQEKQNKEIRSKVIMLGLLFFFLISFVSCVTNAPKPNDNVKINTKYIEELEKQNESSFNEDGTRDLENRKIDTE